ncbi:LPXTG cell wall anchor domain-containing protein [Enterococcus faecalis]
MKKFRHSLNFLLIVWLVFQMIAGFGQSVFAAKTTSNVGITFKGSVPQPDATNPNDQQAKQRGEFPHTNEQHDVMLSAMGGVILTISLVLLFWGNRKRKNEQ